MIPQLAAVALGIWLMAAPAVLGYGDPAATNDRVVGPLAAALALVAATEVTRSVRWANLPIGAWLVAAPLALGYATLPLVNSIVVGAVLSFLATREGATENRYGGGWWSLVRADDRSSR